jgi:hypothetical protein
MTTGLLSGGSILRVRPTLRRIMFNRRAPLRRGLMLAIHLADNLRPQLLRLR